MWKLPLLYIVTEGDPPILPPRQNGGSGQKSHSAPPPPPPRLNRASPSKNTSARMSASMEKARGHCLWDLTDKYTITVQGVTNLTIAQEYSKVRMYSRQGTHVLTARYACTHGKVHVYSQQGTRVL